MIQCTRCHTRTGTDPLPSAAMLGAAIGARASWALRITDWRSIVVVEQFGDGIPPAVHQLVRGVPAGVNTGAALARSGWTTTGPGFRRSWGEVVGVIAA